MTTYLLFSNDEGWITLPEFITFSAYKQKKQSLISTNLLMADMHILLYNNYKYGRLFLHSWTNLHYPMFIEEW